MRHVLIRPFENLQAALVRPVGKAASHHQQLVEEMCFQDS